MARIVWNSIGTSRLTQWDREQVELGKHPGDDGSGRDFRFDREQLMLVYADDEAINVARMAPDDEATSVAEKHATEARIAAESAMPVIMPTHIDGVHEAAEHADVFAYVEALKLEILELSATADRMAAQNSALNTELALALETLERERTAYQLELHSKTATPSE